MATNDLLLPPGGENKKILWPYFSFESQISRFFLKNLQQVPDV